MSEPIDFRLRMLVGRVRLVRRWLIALTILKVAALSLLFVVVFVGAYSWIDHRVHLPSYVRAAALVGLYGGLLVLLWRLGRRLLGHISSVEAANYIESKIDLDQQLVTAIEYHENKQRYPYSNALAQHLVVQVDKASQNVVFDSSVPKWQAFLLTIFILLALSLGGWLLQKHFAFFSRYFTRLTTPMAAVEPLPATSLEAVTKDIMVEPQQEFDLVANIHGRLPAKGEVIIENVEQENQSETENETSQAREIYPAKGPRDNWRLRAQLSLTGGKYRYHFTAAEAVSSEHGITVCTIPKIKSITARVVLESTRWLAPYNEIIKDNTLEVTEHSRVKLTVEATENLSEVIITWPDGSQTKKTLDETSTFETRFDAEDEGFIKFQLTSADGIVNDRIPALQLMFKKDEPVQFKLVSPGGDYLATNVASVPVSFEANDDFGLEWVRLAWEIPGREPQFIAVDVEKESKKVSFTHVFELENHDLATGDSLLFYAVARDINTGMNSRNTKSTSDNNFGSSPSR